MKWASYRLTDSVVIQVHTTDPSVPNGMLPGLASHACDDDGVQVGWLVQDGKARSQEYWYNLPILEEIEVFEAKADTPRARREYLLGKDGGFLEAIQEDIVKLRGSLK